jgi:hypothetical protein
MKGLARKEVAPDVIRERVRPRAKVWRNKLLGIGAIGAALAFGGCATTQTNIQPINTKPITTQVAVTETETLQPMSPQLEILKVSNKKLRKVEIGGLDVYPLRLTDTISNLEAKSRGYQRGEITENGTYMNSLAVGEVGLGGVVSIQLGANEVGKNTFGVVFPALDGSGMTGWGVDISNFKAMLKEKTGLDIKTMPMIVEKRTTTDGLLFNIVAVPHDAAGNMIGQYEGKQLGLKIEYNPQKRVASGDFVYLVQPETSGVGPLASR